MSVVAATVRCDTCPHGCLLAEGQLGACRARCNRGGVIVCENYGRVTSLALDPIEKKPLHDFYPGSFVVSVGSYGCNLACPFCQNHEISQASATTVGWRTIAPDELVATTVREQRRSRRVIGIAYTYNEPLVGWEYVRDCSELAHESGLVNVLVSSGCANEAPVRALAPLIDAANIDLKAFRADFYRTCRGDLAAVQRTIEILAATPTCHLEVTTLVVPGMNDGDEDMDAEACWLASLDPGIGLHITRFFPRWHMSATEPTPIATLERLAKVARGHLDHVYLGNC